MKKTLVYHVYLSDDIDTNMSYKINAECIKYFINNFDYIKYVLVMDDISNTELKIKGFNYITQLNFNGEFDVIYRQNTDIGEAATVRDYVINTNNDTDSMVFFCHTKGVTNFKQYDNTLVQESIFNWILTMYFYNLYYINEAENAFQGKGMPINAFYGTLLMQVVNRKSEKMQIMLPNKHYSGSFYWVNKPFLAKVKNIVNMDDYVFSNRYDAEFWPGYMFGDDGFGKGLASHNGVVLKIDDICGAFYCMTDEMWDIVFTLLGDKEKFYIFKDEIKSKIDILKLNNKPIL